MPFSSSASGACATRPRPTPNSLISPWSGDSPCSLSARMMSWLAASSGGVELRVLGVDRDEELDHLVGGDTVEDDRGHLHVLGLSRRDHLVEGEQPVLAVERAQHPFVSRDLQYAKYAMRAGRRELEPAVRYEQHRPRDGGQVPDLGALVVVVDQLADLLPDHGALVGLGAGGDALLEQLPVHARRLRLALAVPRPRSVRGVALVGQDLEADQAVDVARTEHRLVEHDAELVEADRRNRDHPGSSVTAPGVAAPRAARPPRRPRSRRA